MSSEKNAKRLITLDRTYKTSLDTMWDLWTSKAGIESWWGPDGFEVEVLALELRKGGALHYAMTAVAPAMVEYMKNAGMPVTNEAHATIVDAAKPHRFAYDSLIDFVPGVTPYAIANVIEMSATADGVRVVSTFEALHDEEWTGRLVMGRESQLDKLAKVIGAREGRA